MYSDTTQSIIFLKRQLCPKDRINDCPSCQRVLRTIDLLSAVGKIEKKGYCFVSIKTDFKDNPKDKNAKDFKELLSKGSFIKGLIKLGKEL